MFKVDSRTTRRRYDMFKIRNNDNRAMTSFCCGVDRVL